MFFRRRRQTTQHQVWTVYSIFESGSIEAVQIPDQRHPVGNNQVKSTQCIGKIAAATKRSDQMRIRCGDEFGRCPICHPLRYYAHCLRIVDRGNTQAEHRKAHKTVRIIGLIYFFFQVFLSSPKLRHISVAEETPRAKAAAMPG